jgi:hypothetical protein
VVNAAVNIVLLILSRSTNVQPCVPHLFATGEIIDLSGAEKIYWSVADNLMQACLFLPSYVANIFCQSGMMFFQNAVLLLLREMITLFAGMF